MREFVRGEQNAPDQEESHSPRVAPGPAGDAAQHLVFLQRAGGNAAVNRLLMAQQAGGPVAGGPVAGGPVAAAPRVSYVFFMGDIKNDNFYNAAAKFFANMVKGAQPITGKRTLAEIIEHVNAAGKPVDKLYIVSHANESGNLGFSLNTADLTADRSGGDRKPRLEFPELEQANQDGSLPRADTTLIDGQTQVLIKGCNIGRSALMLDELDEAFGGAASVSAPTHKQEYRYYGTKGGPVYEENFSDMFVEEPGAVEKDRAALSTAFESKYPMVPAGNWKGLLKTVKKTGGSQLQYTWRGPNPPEDTEAAVIARTRAANQWPQSAGWVITYQGRRTVGDVWEYTLDAERVLKDGGTESQNLVITVGIPPAEAALIAQERAKQGRPDAYNWRVKRSVVGEQLVLDVIAERTEWVIRGTIRDATGPVHRPETDPGWYGTSTFPPPTP